MAAVDEILQNLPIDQIAQQLGEDPQAVQQAAQAAVPALLGGLHANAQDASGATSIVDALGQHDNGLLDGGVDLDQVDQAEGQKIASHIFGSNEQQVYSALGGGSADSLVKRLIPILAPIVLSYISSKVIKGGGSGGAGGSLDSILKDVLNGALGGGSAQQQAPAPQQPSAGGSVLEILGGLLGAGRR